MSNHYQTLGVDRNATPDEIKKAYRKLASQHHPDKGGDKTKFQEIQSAYDTLSNPQKRAMHDSPQNPFSSTNGQGFDFDSIFNVFGARFNQPRQHQRAMMTLWITLPDVARGGPKTVSVGTHQGTMTVEIEIPPGIDDGASVQYPGIGPGGMDLVITFRVHPNPQWSRQGSNLVCEQAVSIWDLILGSDVMVRDVLGNTLSLAIPPRTQPGTVFRLKERGLRQRSGSPGDLLVQIQAQIPDNISDELLSQIKQYK
jgi:curved DNA-binding protein